MSVAVMDGTRSHTHACRHIYTHRASGCILFGPPLQQLCASLAGVCVVCVFAGTQPNLVVCPTTPDSAVFTSRMSFCFEDTAFIMLVHVWGTLRESLRSVQVAHELISGPTLGFLFSFLMLHACVCGFECVYVTLITIHARVYLLPNPQYLNVTLKPLVFLFDL